MITRLSNKVTAIFVAKGIIEQDDHEVYEYSFELMIATLFNLILILAIGFGTCNFLTTVLFAITFATIRTVAGGYHAGSHFRCMAILVVDFSILIVMLELMPARIMNIFNIVLLSFGAVAILILPSVDSINNELSKKRKNKLKLISVIYVTLYTVSSIVLIYYSLYKIALSITYAIFSVSLSMIAGIIKNKFKGEGENE